MKEYKNKYLAICIPLGLSLGSCIGIIMSIIMSRDNFIFSISLGAGFGMLIGIIIGSVLDNNKKNKFQFYERIFCGGESKNYDKGYL